MPFQHYVIHFFFNQQYQIHYSFQIVKILNSLYITNSIYPEYLVTGNVRRHFPLLYKYS